MKARIEKTFSYDAYAALALFAECEALPPYESLMRRREILDRLQSEWIKAGRVGPNPKCVYWM